MLDSAGNPLPNPQQYIVYTNHFRKLSQEIARRFTRGPPDPGNRGRFLQRQTNFIHQDYKVDGLAPDLSVNGHPGTLWLTQQKREDKDYALFGEASFDILRNVTITGGGRLFKYDNTLIGFFGLAAIPGDGENGPFSATPPNGNGSNRTGVAGCWTTSGSAALRQGHRHVQESR